jgi:hypothetical protein
MAIDKSGPGITSSGRPLLVSRSSGITERTLDLDEAVLLRRQPEEVRARTKRGLIPGAKPGGCWVFHEPDPADLPRSLHPGMRQALHVHGSQGLQNETIGYWLGMSTPR